MINTYMKDQNHNVHEIETQEKRIEELEELLAERDSTIENMESDMRDKFNQEKIQYDRKIKDLETKVNELIDYEEKQDKYNQEMEQLKS